MFGVIFLFLMKYYYIYQFTVYLAKEETNWVFYLCYFSLIGLIFFSYNYGYKILYEKWKCRQLKSIREHSQILYFCLEDIQSLIMSVFIGITYFNLWRLRFYRFREDQRVYYQMCRNIFFLTLLDIALIPSWVILFVFHWRFRLTLAEMKFHKDRYFKQRWIVVYQMFQCLIDIPFILMALLICFSVMQK